MAAPILREAPVTRAMRAFIWVMQPPLVRSQSVNGSDRLRLATCVWASPIFSPCPNFGAAAQAIGNSLWSNCTSIGQRDVNIGRDLIFVAEEKQPSFVFKTT